MRAPSRLTLREAAEAWLAGARDGAIRNRSGDRYKPSVVRGYETALRLRVLPELGGAQLSEIRRADVQDFVDRLLARRASTRRRSATRSCRCARSSAARSRAATSPSTRRAGLELPAVRGRRDRIASPAEAAALLDALPERDRALWATALYAGLRRGELQALRWEDVDLAAGVIRVERAWDAQRGRRSSRSAAPAAARCRSPACCATTSSSTSCAPAAQRARVRRRATAQPFDAVDRSRERAKRAWRAAGLEPIDAARGRHTFASLMIAAGVNAKALATYMGHASVTITFDRYGHLMPGNEGEAAALLDAYLARADTQARLAQLDDRRAESLRVIVAR